MTGLVCFRKLSLLRGCTVGGPYAFLSGGFDATGAIRYRGAAKTNRRRDGRPFRRTYAATVTLSACGARLPRAEVAIFCYTATMRSLANTSDGRKSTPT